MAVVVAYRIKVKTKLFCSCTQGNTCEICRRIIGMLPMLNSEALRKTVIAATLVKSNLSMSTFSRIPCVYHGVSGYVRSTRLSPIGVDGQVDGTRLLSVYLQEDLELHDGLCGGMPLLCFKADSISNSSLAALTSILESNDITVGEPTVSPEDQVPSGIELPEPELDMCMVHIDPYSAEKILGGEEIHPLPIDMG